MSKCVMSVCGRLNCKMNTGGKCLNKIISLDSEGKCVCYRTFREDSQIETSKHNSPTPFSPNSNAC